MKNKEQLAEEFANSLQSIKDIDCPRYCKNPGLYFGFIKGYEAAQEEIETLKYKLHVSLSNGLSYEDLDCGNG